MSKINLKFFLEIDAYNKNIIELLQKLSGSNNKKLRKMMVDIFFRDKEYDIRNIENEVLIEICNIFYNIGVDDYKLSEIIKKIGYKRDYDSWIEGGKYQPTFSKYEVTVVDLWIDKYQVTQSKWRDIMGTEPSSNKGQKKPVDNISWIDALHFCNKISKKCGLQPVYKIENGVLIKIISLDGEEFYPNLVNFNRTEGYRLPTELEWEWAARGGNIAQHKETFNLKYSGSDNINEVAWYNGNSENQTHDVGCKNPNQLGLYDMSGNVLEWCYDSSSANYISKDKLYLYSESIGNRRLKGGSWYSSATSTEVTNRGSSDLADWGYRYGFRICRTV